MADANRVKTRYRHFAENECKGYSDLYYSLAHAVADNDDLVEFIAGMPVVQPNLFFASIQFLTGPDGMPESGDQLASMVQKRRQDLTTLMRSRRTQTNEVGRCATILPALPRGRLALLEVGASAGLCLLLDQFHYDYDGRQLGNTSADVCVRCNVNDSFPLPDVMPEIVWRCGLDLSPVNLMDDDDVRWLLSCVWADHFERRKRLAAAIQLAQADKPLLHQGNLVSDLGVLLTHVPTDADLVVFHSAVLAYLTNDDRISFANCLAEASHHRNIVWISNESPTVVPEITALAPRIEPSKFLLGRTSFADGNRQDELLALAHPHGAALEWLAQK